MTTAIAHRRIGKTGRPLGLLDVLSKIVETATAGLQLWRAERQASARLGAAVREAAALRRLADRHRRQEPAFAADLYAAADRHDVDAGR